MKVAQDAIYLPEIEAIAKTLAKYNLGIFMPHMHEERTGRSIDLPDGMQSVEDGLEVSFHKEEDLQTGGKEYVDVAWQWIDDGVRPRMGCTSRCVKQGTMHTTGRTAE